MRLWQGRRQREHQIKQAQATADAERAVLRRQLDELLRILASVGATADSVAADAVKGIPAGLMAASSVDHRPGGYPVRLRTDTGREVIAVIEGIGSPTLWWDEIQAKVSQSATGVPRINHAHLSPGLSVIATRDTGAIALTVSTTLTAPARRAAVVTALRAARRAGWTTRRVPALLFPLALPGILYPARRLLEHVRLAHVAAATATGAAVVVGIALLPSPAHRPARAVPPAAAAPSPQHVRRTRQAAKPDRKRKPQRAPVPSPAPTLMAVSQTPQPKRSPSAPTSPSPTPSPTTSPAPDPCIPLLLVCVDIA